MQIDEAEIVAVVAMFMLLFWVGIAAFLLYTLWGIREGGKEIALELRRLKETLPKGDRAAS